MMGFWSQYYYSQYYEVADLQVYIDTSIGFEDKIKVVHRVENMRFSGSARRMGSD